MLNYLLKRILLMIPTFFAISLIIFLILNLAPGKPGASMVSGDTAQDATGANREAYRIFKAQFNLDKPVLFNTWFALSDSKIEKLVYDLSNEKGDVPMKDVIKAQDTLEDYGQYAVPGLMHVLRTASSDKVRDNTVTILAQNAQRNLVDAYSSNISEKNLKLNAEIDQENNVVRNLTYESGAPAEEKEEVIAKWNRWYDEYESRFRYSFGRSVAIFFLDTRFANYWNKLLRFDFGVSHLDKQPVFPKILSKLKYSLTLSVPSVIIAYIIAVPLGVFSAVRQNTLADRVITVVLFMLYSLPSFFVATLLLLIFSKGGGEEFAALHWFPTGQFQSSSYESLTVLEKIKDVSWHLVLPLVAMTYGSFASLSRYSRSGMLEVIRSDYVRTARAKGLSEFVVIVKHAMRNGMIPIITLLGTLLPVILGGSVVIEYIFGIPGMGLLTINSIYGRDYNVIMGIQLISATLVLIGILLSDIMYALVDPRISFK